MYDRRLNFAKLPAEISSMIVEFWLPKNYKKLEKCFDELFDSFPDLKGGISITNIWFIPYLKLRPRLNGILSRDWVDWISPSAAAMKRSECFKLYSKMVHASDWACVDDFFPRIDNLGSHGQEIYESEYKYIAGVYPVTENTTFQEWCQIRIIIRPSGGVPVDEGYGFWDHNWRNEDNYNFSKSLVY